MRFIILSLLVLFVVGIPAELVTKYSIEIIEQGTDGTTPQKGQSVEMHYEGTLKDGKKFDSSYDRDTPLPVRIGAGQVIKCWD